MKRERDGFEKMLIFCAGIMLSGIIGVIMVMISGANPTTIGGRELYALGYLLVPIYMICGILYIGFIDSKKRWPHLKNAWERMGVALSFDEHREDIRARQYMDGREDVSPPSTLDRWLKRKEK